MALRRVRSVERSSEQPSFWMSFTDLMSALLFVFILAAAALMLQLIESRETFAAQTEEFSDQVSNLREAEEMRADMLVEVQEDLEQQGIEVIVAQNGSVISIPSELLGFDSASYDIEDEYQDVSLAIGTALSEAVQKDGRQQFLDTVFVEGHTDNANYSGLEGTGNWGLSTFRAISLWRLWEDELPAASQLSDLTGPEGQPLFSVSGYGPTRPMNEDQSTESSAAANRRIDIRFTIVRPDSAVLEGIEKDAVIE